jgi:hypothetical protein
VSEVSTNPAQFAELDATEGLTARTVTVAEVDDGAYHGTALPE